MTNPFPVLKQKLNSRVVISALAAILVVVAGIIIASIINKPAPPVVKNSGPGTKLSGTDGEIKQKLNAQQVMLENYRTNTKLNYPGELSQDVLTQQSGVAGDSSFVFVPPQGIKFVYSALPKGCTTAANNCTDFTLEATDAKNKVVYSVKSVKVTPPPAGAQFPPPKT